jgi:hypothetical protein
MTLTFQQLKAKYDKPGSENLQAERAAMSEMIRAGRPRIRPQAAVDLDRHDKDLSAREVDLAERKAGLDQGSRGGAAHAPEKPPGMNDLLRGMRNGGD